MSVSLTDWASAKFSKMTAMKRFSMMNVPITTKLTKYGMATR